MQYDTQESFLTHVCVDIAITKSVNLWAFQLFLWLDRTSVTKIINLVGIERGNYTCRTGGQEQVCHFSILSDLELRYSRKDEKQRRTAQQETPGTCSWYHLGGGLATRHSGNQLLRTSPKILVPEANFTYFTNFDHHLHETVCFTASFRIRK